MFFKSLFAMDPFTLRLFSRQGDKDFWGWFPYRLYRRRAVMFWSYLLFEQEPSDTLSWQYFWPSVLVFPSFTFVIGASNREAMNSILDRRYIVVKSSAISSTI
jgi:hypothetical protein